MRISPGHFSQIFVPPPATAEPPEAWLSSSQGFLLLGGVANLGFGVSCPAMSHSTIAHQQSMAAFSQLLQTVPVPAVPGSGEFPKASMGWGHHSVPNRVCRAPHSSFQSRLPMVLGEQHRW